MSSASLPGPSSPGPLPSIPGVVAVDHDGIISLIERIFEEALPSLFTGLEPVHGADQLVARNFRTISTRQLFTLKCLCLARDGHDFVSSFIYDHFSMESLRLLQCILDGEGQPSAVNCTRVVVAIAIGYVAYYHSTPLRGYLRDNLDATNGAYCAELSLQSARDRALCYTAVSLQNASGGSYDFSGLPAFRHLF